MKTGFKILLIGFMIIGMGCGVAAAESAPNASVTNVSSDVDSATIDFNVNQSDASTRIAYGISNSLSSWSDWNYEDSNSRSIVLSELNDGTMYYYSVYAYNGTNDSFVYNTTISTFNTDSPTAPNASVTNVSSDVDSATIDFNVNQSDASTRIAYGISNSLSSWSDWNYEDSNSRSIVLSELNDRTMYYYSVYAYNGTNDSFVYNTTIATLNTTSPTAPNASVTNVSSDVDSATIDFNVNQSDASTRIAYGISNSLSSWSDWNYEDSNSRSIVLSELNDGTMYYYSVYAYNGTNDSFVYNTTIATLNTTSPTAPSISDISSSNIGGDRATINYVVNQSDAPTRIAYGTSSDLSSYEWSGWFNDSTVHNETISNLNGSTKYYYSIYAYNESNNSVFYNSSIESFTTISNWGDRIWDEKANQSNKYTWDGRSFSGFYYDLDTGDTSESMTITIDGRRIDDGDLVYTTKPIDKEFEFGSWGEYQIIGFMAERYFAGYSVNTSSDVTGDDVSLISDGVLSKVLIDTDDDESVYSGSSLTLEEGYSLNIKQVDVNGDSVWISLTKDGDEVDDAILSSDETYVYEKDLGGVDDVPVIAVHIDDVFSGTETNAVFIDGIFQISDDYVEVDRGDEFGEMEVTSLSSTEIKMENEDSISLDEGDIIDIMGKLKFIVADDNDVLRFAPFVDMSEPGTYELRGTIAEDEGFSWTPLNFEGFYYDIDEGLRSESLNVTNYNGRNIDAGDLIYKSTPVEVEFEYGPWGKYNVIGFMAEKYFAGYSGDTSDDITDDTISLMSSGQLSKVLIDDDDEKSVYTGSSLILEEGYALNIREIDVNGDRVMIQLTQDGDNIESAIVSSDDEYVYEKDVGDEDDVPIIVVHFNEIFSGTETSAVFVEGIFQISEDYLEVEDGDDFGVMTVDSTSGSIILENEDNIDLDEGDTIDIMGEIKFKVADDSSTVRYYPFVEVETKPYDSLDIDIEPTTVVEGDEITFTVTSRGAAIRDASILIHGDRVGITSDEGVFEYDADDAGKFTATAEKEGYVSSKGNFEVISPDDESKKISIEVSPEEVFEGTPITISVVKAIGSEPLEGAEVFFDGKSLGETDEDGTITYNPKEPGTHKIEAKVDGYLDAELNIKVNELAANFEFSNLRIDPLPATAGEEFTVMLDSINTGNAEGSYTVELSINDNVVDSQEITLGQNNSTTIEFTSTAGEPGTYLVKAGGLSTTMDVEEGTSIVWYVLGGLVLVLGGGAAYIFATGGTAKFAEIAESLRSRLGR
ncbi:S-layer protein domain-containing protein [Methanohalophilus mahii]|uniref:S-layer-related duplication domain protein n=1 Tax=Methanohalophilus mahii (strain ATCC 35705 / DSM 5219 / SLP) TaxID=547558 RepID=D5E9K3_METMS|nr:S-layer protein domain-containing protein [Methanohalophilus mahii]ADE35854.1 S-layer-related duplication domain protein [Methanohalophilus mahii DSM 5219]